jgi:uncharacterized protein (DUF1778 family)
MLKFIIGKVAACQVMEQHQTLKLNQEDSEAFANALLNPPKPNQALKTACLRYQKIIQNGADKRSYN